MTPAQFEMRVWYRARVLCATAEPHCMGRRPCQRHEEEARHQLRDEQQLVTNPNFEGGNEWGWVDA